MPKKRAKGGKAAKKSKAKSKAKKPNVCEFC